MDPFLDGILTDSKFMVFGLCAIGCEVGVRQLGWVV